MNVEYSPDPRAGGLSDRELMLQFESIGDSCEFGLVQRKHGAEPLGLLRFSGVPVRHLVRALENRFEGTADPDQIGLQVENGEYMVKLRKYDLVYHAYVLDGEMDPAELHQREVRRTGFLVQKFLADLESAAKILVFRQNEPVLAHDLVMLRAALSRYGRSTLLWVQETSPGHPPGTAELADEQLVLGYVRWLSPRQDAHNIDHASWLSLCRQAGDLCRPPVASPPLAVALPETPPDPGRPLRSAITFGKAGNQAGHLGFGWSAAENGFTWSIDDKSLVTLEPPAVAGRYVLDMDVVPLSAPAVLPGQRLRVLVNGELVHSMERVPRGRVSCIIPARLIEGRDKVDILFEHPDAARPCDLLNETDDRRLAVAFEFLSLTGVPA